MSSTTIDLNDVDKQKVLNMIDFKLKSYTNQHNEIVKETYDGDKLFMEQNKIRGIRFKQNIDIQSRKNRNQKLNYLRRELDYNEKKEWWEQENDYSTVEQKYLLSKWE